MYKDTITLFNRKEGTQGDVWYPTVLHNVHLNMDKAAIIAKYGAESADAAMVNIRYKLQKASIASDDAQPFSAQEKIGEAADIPWVTLEQSGWVLNGTGQLMQADQIDLGWWSAETSGEDGTFANPPTLTVSFAKPYSADGIHFLFWESLNHWCSKIRVVWYRENNVLAEIVAYPKASQWDLPYSLKNFDRVEISFLQTNAPQQLAKLQKLNIGQMRAFDTKQAAFVEIGGKRWLPPKEWEAAEDHSKAITFTTGTRFDFFWLGDWGNEDPIFDSDYFSDTDFYTYMNRTHDYVFAISSVGGPYSVIPHFEIMGK